MKKIKNTQRNYIIGRISTSTNPTVVNQLQEYLSKISSGYPGVEIQTLTFSGEKGPWSRIPRQIFEEIARNARNK